jgi:hypothetical protein
VPLDEAPALSLFAFVESPSASEPLAVVDDASPCVPGTNSGVWLSIKAVCDVEVSASFATGLPAVFGEASLPASFAFALPSGFDGASVCVFPGKSSACDSIAAVGDEGFSAS